MASHAWFITGTDTGIGKTLVSCAMLRSLAAAGMRAAGMKPVAAGAQMMNGAWHNEDADQIAAASAVSLPQALTTPYLFREAIAPHIASALERRDISMTHILDCYQQVAAESDAVVVEGVGGFKVPLDRDSDTADLAKALDLPVVLVVGVRLGCLSHALLSADAIRYSGLQLAGWVANAIEVDMPHAQANIDTLAQRLDAPLLGSVPRLANPTAMMASRYLDFSRLPDWP